MSFVIKTYDGGVVDNKAFKLRHTVFSVEQNIPTELDQDDDDLASQHVVIYDSKGSAVATGRVTIKENEAILARIAVVELHRGKGLGKMVIKSLEQLALPHQPKRLILHPHVHLQRFYEDLGYRLDSAQIIEVANVKLFKMFKVVEPNSNQ